MIAVTVLITSCQVSTLGTTDSVGTHNTTTSTQIVKNQPLETHSLVCVANPSKLACIYFFAGMTITTISVRMEKNSRESPSRADCGQAGRLGALPERGQVQRVGGDPDLENRVGRQPGHQRIAQQPRDLAVEHLQVSAEQADDQKSEDAKLSLRQ